MKILADTDFAAAILDLFKASGRIRCAVAFWGPDLAKLAAERDVEVVLDVSMGGTSLNALKGFGLIREQLPKDDLKVTVLDCLHAKIFISQDKAIVGSANASRNALGTAEKIPVLFEAGVVFDRNDDPDEYAKVEEIYETYRTRSRPITPADFDKAVSAPYSAAVRDKYLDESGKSASLLTSLVGDPLAFKGCGFIFGDMEISNEDLDEAKEAYHKEVGKSVSYSGLTHICTFDSSAVQKDELRISNRIFCFWYGRRKGIQAYTDLRPIVAADGSVSYFGKVNWSGAVRECGHSNLRKQDVWEADSSIGCAVSMNEGQPEGERLVVMSAEQLFEYVESAQN